MKRLMGFLCSVSWFFAGCGDEASSLTKDQYIAEGAEQTCSYYMACCDEKERAALKMTDKASCMASVTSTLTTSMKTIPDALWNPEGAGTCMQINKQVMSGCGYIYSLAIASKDQCWPFNSQAQKGQPCTQNYECVTHLCRSGKCTDPSSAGGACTSNTECGQGLLCNSTSKTCYSPLSDGAVCKTSSECLSQACTQGRCARPTAYMCDGQ